MYLNIDEWAWFDQAKLNFVYFLKSLALGLNMFAFLDCDLLRFMCHLVNKLFKIHKILLRKKSTIATLIITSLSSMLTPHFL